MEFTTLFIDLDDTLYSSRSGLWQAIKERMNEFMHTRLGIPWEDIPRLREAYYQEYGTTLRGLEANHQVDTQDFLAFVHDLPLDSYIFPNPVLRAVFESLPHRKLIFTNADRSHALRVLGRLGLQDCFDGIIDVNMTAPYCKPMPEAFTAALKAAGEDDPQRCVMIDDLPRTTRAARALGMFSILYGADGGHPDADATLTDWNQLKDLLNGHNR